MQWAVVWLVARRVDADDAGVATTLLNVVLLLPLALLAVYAIAASLGGPRLGLFAAALWALGPFALVPLFDERYRGIYEDRFLAQASGLTEAGEFYAAVALLACAFFVARALRSGRLLDGALAGIAAAVACAVDSSSALFLPAPLVALALARRRRALAPLAVGAVAGLLLAGVPPAPDDWGNLGATERGIREFFWSVRVLEWLPLAGVLGVARRSLPLAALLALWFGLYLVFRGTDPEVTIGGGTFFLALLPVLPAYALLAAAIPLLAPPLPSLRGLAPRRVRPSRR